MTIVRDWHTTDEPGEAPGKRRRTIGNWINYRDTAGVWRKTDLKVRRAEAGDEFLGRPLDWVSSGAPIQFFVGDAAATGGRPWWGARKSDNGDSGIVMFLESGDAAAGYTVDAAKRSVTYEDVLPDTDLVLYADDWKVEKWLALHTATSGEGGTGDRAVLGFVLPDGWSLEVIDSGTAGNRIAIKRANGEVVYRTRPAMAIDSAAEPQAVPCTFIRPTPATATLGGVTYWRVRVRCTPAGFVRPVLMDPSITITGSAAIVDDGMRSDQPTWNAGAFSFVQSGNVNTVQLRGLVKILDMSVLPAGTVTSFRYLCYIAGYTEPASVDFRAITDANTWTEGGSANGATPSVGGPCWGHAVYDTVAWAGSAGCSTDGTDTHTEANYPTWNTAPNNVTQNTWQTTQLTPGWAEKWRDGTWTNNGFLIKNTRATGSYRGSYHRSQEYTTTSLRPYFEIDYDEPPPPVTDTAQYGLLHVMVMKTKEVHLVTELPLYGKDFKE